MPQIFIPPDCFSGDRFVVTGPEAHHLIRVLRKNASDEITLFDGTGRRFKGQLTAVRPKESRAEGRITQTMEPEQSPIQIHLYQGLPKGSKFDFVIEKAAELGAAAVIPFVSQKNPVQLKGKEEHKAERWGKVALAAAKQCGRATLPQIGPVVSLTALSEDLQKGLTLLLSPDENSRPLKEVLEKNSDYKGRINVVIGPESGFSSDELTWCRDLGAQEVSLGSLVLRSETAGLVVIAILNFTFSKNPK